MNFKLESIATIRPQLELLGISGEKDILILPRGYAEVNSLPPMVHHSEAITLAKLLRLEGLETSLAKPHGRDLPLLQENDVNWIAPVLFISASVLSQNPNAVDIAINVIASYIYEMFRGRSDVQSEIEILKEGPDGTFERYYYSGSASGLPEARRIFADARRGKKSK